MAGYLKQRIIHNQLRIVAILPEEREMQKLVKRSEQYREKAAKRAHPPYLGEFYRGIAVRYAFMAQELSHHAEKELGPTRERRDGSTNRAQDHAVQDLDLLAVWAKENSDRLANGRMGLDQL
jgi:hypothetical protein